MEDIKEVLSLMVLSSTPMIGGRIIRSLVARFGSATAVLATGKGQLLRTSGIGEVLADNIGRKDSIDEAKRHLDYCVKNDIQIVHFKSKSFPRKLRSLPDSPVILYKKGKLDLNNAHFIGIVGTRKPSHYGKLICDKLLADLSDLNIVTVSGLAYGIDILIHKKSIQYQIPTIGVLAHGLNFMYPTTHQKIAHEMIKDGALLTEFNPFQKAERNNFPARNRIIAGLVDALVVVESGSSGGSMITAEFANQYSREVFAFPGRANDALSRGCNHLIKTNKAHLIESGDDLKYMLDLNSKSKEDHQLQLFNTLDNVEKRIVETVQQYGTCLLDRLILSTNLNFGELSSYLIKMECKGILTCLPGKRYVLDSWHN